jgi:hypothetical protein
MNVILNVDLGDEKTGVDTNDYDTVLKIIENCFKKYDYNEWTIKVTAREEE